MTLVYINEEEGQRTLPTEEKHSQVSFTTRTCCSVWDEKLQESTGTEQTVGGTR